MRWNEKSYRGWPARKREGICWTEEIALAKKDTEMWGKLALLKNREYSSL